MNPHHVSELSEGSGLSVSSEPTVPLPVNRGLYFAGSWANAADGERSRTYNPASGASLGWVAQAGVADVDAAVRAAYAGFRQWRDVKPNQRGRLLRQAAAVIRDHARELALIDAANTGNPVREMIGDVEMAATSIEYFAGLANETQGTTLPMGPGTLNYTVREPLGVVARISAYNHPLLFAAMRLGAPLAAGNSVIIKPPDQAPLSTLRLAELIGGFFPAGVFSVMPGGATCGAALVAHPLVAKVGLIGSVSTGKAVFRSGAETLKKFALELGGKNAMIVFGDADLDSAVTGAIKGMNFAWCGQSCGSTSRLFVHESLHDEVVEKIAARLSTLKPGMPTDYETQMGCLISQAHYDKVLQYVKLAQDEGARLVTGGQRPSDPSLANGFFFLPTVFTDVTADMRAAREEIFGPVLCVLKWHDEAAMIEAVNSTEYGLTASIWTRDLTRALRTAAAVEAGYVWVNGNASHFLGAPFGGYKQSGLGREECMEELLDSTQIKNVNISLEGPS